ncbi:hypothetical protein FKM82_026239, partial [Ascaphus truei]
TSSVTLLSLSSISDGNSTRSLIQSDSGEVGVGHEMPCGVDKEENFSRNLLVDYKVESFKRDPRQSLTPTHVTAASASMIVSRGHRRTPSDGAIRQVTQGHRRSPSDGSAPQLCDTGSNVSTPFPRLPDPHSVYPPLARRKPPDKDPTVERPKTLEFAPRPRPSPSRPRLDPWKCVSLSQTHSSPPPRGGETPSSSTAEGGRETLLDMEMEGQNLDNTVPLCEVGIMPPGDTFYNLGADVS